MIFTEIDDFFLRLVLKAYFKTSDFGFNQGAQKKFPQAYIKYGEENFILQRRRVKPKALF